MDKCKCVGAGPCEHMEACAEWATPCWLNADAYAFVKKLNSKEMRWEFLRRLPLYRGAWARSGNSKGGFGLKRLIDPRLQVQQLQAGDLKMLEATVGVALADAISVPPIAALFDTTTLSSRHNIDLFLGARVQHLIDQGCVLFVTHPALPTQKQIKKISDQLASMRKEWREEATETGEPKNAPKQHSTDSLLRVLDAYSQEKLLSRADRRGHKTRIGKTIFVHHDIGETSWSNFIDAAYRRAENIGLTPVLNLR